MTRYSLQFYEDGLRSDGFYGVETAEEIFTLISHYRPTYPTRVVIRKHEIEHECDICSAGSIVETIRLNLNEKG